MGGNQSKPKRVAVLGGGPAGLTAAYCLVNGDKPVRVDVFEAQPRVGGAVITESGGGFTYDLGPNSMNAKHPAVADLLYKRLGLGNRIVVRESARRFLVVDNNVVKTVPASPGMFLKSPLLSPRAKLRLLAEPFIPRVSLKSAERETVGEFFKRRFGREVVDKLIDPMLAGIYSASPSQLSMKHAMRNVWTLERIKGSVIGGLLRGGVKTPVDERYGSYSKKELMDSFNFDNGMETLTTALYKGIEDAPGSLRRVRTGSTVRRVDQRADGSWSVNGRGRYDAVVSTLPTYALKNVSSNVRAVRKGFERLGRWVKYAPVSVAVVGYEKDRMPAGVHGFGALIPSREGRDVLGVNFTSEGFPGRLTEPGRVFWTVYLGGGRNTAVASWGLEQVKETCVKELRHIFGVKGEPSFIKVHQWERGIPTYGRLYDTALCTMSRVERGAPGLVLGGNYRGGVGVPDALLSGITSAERVVDYLTAGEDRFDAGRALPVEATSAKVVPASSIKK